MSSVGPTNQTSILINWPEKQIEGKTDEKIKQFIQQYFKTPTDEFVNFFKKLQQKEIKLWEKALIENQKDTENLHFIFESLKHYLSTNNIDKTIPYDAAQNIVKLEEILKTKAPINENTLHLTTNDFTLRQDLILVISQLITAYNPRDKLLTNRKKIDNQICQILYEIGCKISFAEEAFRFDDLIKKFHSIDKGQVPTDLDTMTCKKLIAIKLLIENSKDFLDFPMNTIRLSHKNEKEEKIKPNEWCADSKMLLVQYQVTLLLFNYWSLLFIAPLSDRVYNFEKNFFSTILKDDSTALDSLRNKIATVINSIQTVKDLVDINFLERIKNIKTIRNELQLFLNKFIEKLESSKMLRVLKNYPSIVELTNERNEIISLIKSLGNEEAFDSILKHHYILVSLNDYCQNKQREALIEQYDKAKKVARLLIKESAPKEKKLEIITSNTTEDVGKVISPIIIDESLLSLLSEVKKEHKSISSNSYALHLQFSRKLTEIHEKLLLNDSKYSKEIHPLFEAFQHITMSVNTHDLLLNALKKGNINALIAIFPSLALDYHCAIEQLLSFYAKQKVHSLEELYNFDIKFEVDKNFRKNYDIGLLHSRYPYTYLIRDSGNELLAQIQQLINLKQLFKKNYPTIYPKEIFSFINFVFDSHTQFQTILLSHIKTLDPFNKELEILEKIAKEVIKLNKGIKKELSTICEKSLSATPRYYSSKKIKHAFEQLIANEPDRFLQSDLNNALYHLMRIESTLDYLEHNFETRHGAFFYRSVINVHWVIEIIMRYQISKKGAELPESIHDLNALYKALNKDLGDDFVRLLNKFNIAKGSHYSALEGSKKNSELVDSLNYWIQQTSDIEISDKDKKDFKNLAEEGFNIVMKLLEKGK